MIPGWHEFRKLPSLYKLADVCGCAENPCDSLNVHSVHSHMGIHGISWTCSIIFDQSAKNNSPILEPPIHNPHGFSCTKTHPNHHLQSKGHPSPLFRIPPWARNSPSHICTSESKSSDVRDGFTDHGHVQHIEIGCIYSTKYRYEAKNIMELYMWCCVLLFSSDSVGGVNSNYQRSAAVSVCFMELHITCVWWFGKHLLYFINNETSWNISEHRVHPYSELRYHKFFFVFIIGSVLSIFWCNE